MYSTDLHRIFRIGRNLGGHDQFDDFLFVIAKGCCCGDRSVARMGENWHTPPSFCAVAFHNGWEDRNADTRVITADDPSTSDKNLVTRGAVTPEFRRSFAGEMRRAGCTMGFAAHF